MSVAFFTSNPMALKKAARLLRQGGCTVEVIDRHNIMATDPDGNEVQLSDQWWVMTFHFDGVNKEGEAVRDLAFPPPRVMTMRVPNDGADMVCAILDMVPEA